VLKLKPWSIGLLAVAMPISAVASEAYLPQAAAAAMRDARGSLATAEAALSRFAVTANRILPMQSGPQLPPGAETVSTLIQVGTGNSAVIVQTGASNRSFALQQGQNNSARVVQSR